MEVDSNSDKIIYLDNDEFYNKKVYTLYFDNINSIYLEDLIKTFNLNVLSYYIDDNKYYARNIDELNKLFLNDKTLSEKIYYEENGYIITSIKVLCSKEDIIILKAKTHIY